MNAPKQKFGMQELGVFAAVIVALAAFLWLTSGQNASLRNGATGFDGLHIWLKKNGVKSDIANFPRPIPADEIGLRILPIFDTDPTEDRKPARTEQELLLQVDEYDIDSGTVIEKQERAPTLLVFPKWRTGMRLSGVAHPDLLIPPEHYNGKVQQSFLKTTGHTRRLSNGFHDIKIGDSGQFIRLFAPQVLRSSSLCDPVIGDKNTMILARCSASNAYPGVYPSEKQKKGKGNYIWVLSDPDLLNNHGLSLGDNAAIAAKVLGEIAGDKSIIVDYTTYNWVVSKPGEKIKRERTWSDLGQFFAPPLRHPLDRGWHSLASPPLAGVAALWRAHPAV